MTRMVPSVTWSSMNSRFLFTKVRCFSARLQPTKISGVKRVVQEKMPEGINESGLTLTGLLFLHALFTEKGRLETTWTVLISSLGMISLQCQLKELLIKCFAMADGLRKRQPFLYSIKVGDIVSIKVGDIIHAVAHLLEGDPLKINQSALTRESLLVTKCAGAGVYSCSTAKQGEIKAVAIATRVHTFFGKVAHLVVSTNQVLTAIGNICICSIVGMFLEIIVMYPIQHRVYLPGIDKILVLLIIGGTPIAMPTNLTYNLLGGHIICLNSELLQRE